MNRQGLQEKTDNELMELAAEDDKSAFEELVLRYYREAIRAAERMVHDEMQAQDIAQDCFADIYVQRSRYRSNYTFRTYLYTFIKHKSIDYLRKAGKRELLLEREGETAISGMRSQDGSPEEQFFRKERSRALAEHIGELAEVQRKALYLYAVENRSYREIAAMLHKSIPQVKITIYRARKLLKKEMERTDS